MDLSSNTSRLILTAVLTAVLFWAPLSDAKSDTHQAVKAGDILCFGTPDEGCGFDGRWLVLDSEHTNTGDDGWFAVSLSLIGNEQGQPLIFRDIGDVTVSFSDRGQTWAAAHPGATDYQSSDIKQWCEAFLAGHFTAAEQDALLPAYKSDDGIAIPGFGIPLPGAAAGTVDFDPVEGILDGDRLFLLSAEEAANGEYGFTDNRSRVALYKGKAAGYWLRSPHIPTFPLDVGFVFSFGAVMDYPVNGKTMFSMDTYARPACCPDPGKITGLEKLSENGDVTVWRVTFEGDQPNDRTYDLSLPEIGNVPDIQRIISIALPAAAAVVLSLIAILTVLIVRHIKKKRMKTR